jgi:hypothetical protein
MKLRQAWGTPTKGDTPLTSSDEIEFPSLPSLRILQRLVCLMGAV